MKAFPEVNYVKPGGEMGTSVMTISGGMDLRDYFAAKAMQGIISNSDARSTCIEEIDNWIGNYAYTVADAMMEARNAT